MNTYWPIYINLEKELSKLIEYIYIDDTQLTVYSPKISDLILRTCVEIESICKAIYNKNFNPKKESTDGLKFDYDILDKYLIPNWDLDKKIVMLSAINCYQTIKTFYPFQKNEISANKKNIFSWNNAYQNIKHNREQGMKPYGTIKYLFEAMAALYVLNLYYRNDEFLNLSEIDIKKIPPNMGSSFFSVNICGVGIFEILTGNQKKDENFDQSIYCPISTSEFSQICKNFGANFELELNKIASDNSCEKTELDILKELLSKNPIPWDKNKFDLVLNKKQLN